MHMWGDDWFEKYGNDLYEAEGYISRFTKRWSRCYLGSKEKYGTIRYEFIIPPGGHVMMRKFCIYAPWKKRFKWPEGTTDTYRPTLFCWNECWLYYKWQLFGAWVCGIAVKKMVKKYPHLETELRCFFMFNTKYGRQCESEYWVKIGGNDESS